MAVEQGRSGRRKTSSRFKALLMAGAGLAAMASSAWADTIETVVVTAEKRAEDVQTVPISLQVLTSDTLERSNITDVQELQFYTPSLSVSGVDTQSGTANFIIRGVGTSAQGIGVDPAVAVYVDGAYMARSSALLQDFLDLDRVEVLMGPQGTLYGRNATGGAINYISKLPTDTASLDVTANYGSYGGWGVRAIANGPISNDDHLLGRLVVMHHQTFDYSERLTTTAWHFPGNLFAKTTPTGADRFLSDNSWMARGTLSYDPSDRLHMDLSVDYVDNPDDQPFLFKPRVTTGRKIDLSFLFGPGIGAPTNNQNNVYKVYNDVTPIATYREFGTTAHVSYSFDDFDIKSITNFTEISNKRTFDADASEVPFVYGLSTEHSNWLSEELQFVSKDDGAFTWVGGLYFLHQQSHQDLETRFPLVNQILPSYGTQIIDPNIADNAYAAYAQGSYKVIEPLTLTAGVRFSYEQKFNVLRSSNEADFPFFSPIVLPQASVNQQYRAVTWHVGADYTVADDVFAYATISRGFKSGGYNDVVVSTGDQAPFKPENITDYEVGLKSTFPDLKLRANIGLFHYDYSNLQVNSLQPFAIIITNAATATANGLEAEIDWSPLENLTLTGNLALLDSSFDSFPTAQDPQHPIIGPGGVTLPNGASGNVLPNAPKFTSTLIADYRLPVDSIGAFWLRGEWRYTSKQYYDAFQSANLEQKGYNIVNVGAGWTSPNAMFDLSVHGKNIGSTKYLQWSLYSAQVGVLDLWAPPGTWLVKASVHL
jgi:iron complex outermembrane recepter protein